MTREGLLLRLTMRRIPYLGKKFRGALETESLADHNRGNLSGEVLLIRYRDAFVGIFLPEQHVYKNKRECRVIPYASRLAGRFPAGHYLPSLERAPQYECIPPHLY